LKDSSPLLSTVQKFHHANQVAGVGSPTVSTVQTLTKVSPVAAVGAAALSTVLKLSPVYLVAGSGGGVKTESQWPSKTRVRVVTTADEDELHTAEGSSDPDTDFQSLKNFVCVGGLAQLQRDDPFLAQCFIEVKKRDGWFFCDNKEVLYKKQTKTDNEIWCGALLVLPSEFRNPIVSIAHNMGHLGGRKTFSKIKEVFFWSQMRGEICGFCRMCIKCQRQKLVTVLDRIPIGRVEKPASAFDTVSLDYRGPIEHSSGRGHQYILVECIPLKTIPAKKTCSALNIILHLLQILFLCLLHLEKCCYSSNA